MVDGEEIRQFWAHWQHQPDPSAEFERFRKRALNAARDIWTSTMPSARGYRRKFAMLAGTTYYEDYPNFNESGLRLRLEEASNIFEVVEALQNLLWALEEYTWGRDKAYEHLREVFDLSPGIMISIVRSETGVFIYPIGVKMLDDMAIESNLSWLARYPLVQKNFGEALKLYAQKDPKKYRNMLDNLRFTVEQMLQSVLNNTKTLENQKSEFQTWLKGHGVHANIGSMYHTLLFGYFTQYQNDAVKHREDDYTAAEVEFMLYVTGTFLRLIQRLLEQQEVTSTKAGS